MVNIALRVLIIYLIVIGVMRLMGKRQIGELEPFELVITIIIADLATIPMAEQTIPIWYGVVPLLVICVIHFACSLLTKKSAVMRNVINGKPVVVIDDNGIDFKELKKLNISSEELMESLRNLDYFDMSEINYAIIERNGKITVIPKSANMPATREDIKVKTPENDVMYCVIENGKVLKGNFKEMGLEPEVCLIDILRSVAKQGSSKEEPYNKIGGSTTVKHTKSGSTTDRLLKNVSFCSMSESGDVYIQTKDGVAQNFTMKIPQSAFTKEKIKEDKASAKAESKARFA